VQADRLLALDPREPHHWLIKAHLPSAIGDFPAVIEDCRQMLALAPC
jgi:hypothetical protein